MQNSGRTFTKSYSFAALIWPLFCPFSPFTFRGFVHLSSGKQCFVFPPGTVCLVFWLSFSALTCAQDCSAFAQSGILSQPLSISRIFCGVSSFWETWNLRWLSSGCEPSVSKVFDTHNFYFFFPRNQWTIIPRIKGKKWAKRELIWRPTPLAHFLFLTLKFKETSPPPPPSINTRLCFHHFYPRLSSFKHLTFGLICNM